MPYYPPQSSGGVTDGDKGDISVSGGGTVWNIDAGTVSEAEIALSDVTTDNVSTTLHGFAPKAPNDKKRFLMGDGLWGYPIRTNASTTQQTSFTADAYLAGSFVVFPYAPVVGTTYRLLFDVTKTAAGTATPIITVRLGTAGSTADTARITFTFGAGTAAADAAAVEVIATFRTVGSGTTAVLQGVCRAVTNLTTTGWSNAVKTRVGTSAGFDSTVANLGIGVSYNGGASAAHTVQLVRAELVM